MGYNKQCPAQAFTSRTHEHNGDTTTNLTGQLSVHLPSKSTSTYRSRAVEMGLLRDEETLLASRLPRSHCRSVEAVG